MFKVRGADMQERYHPRKYGWLVFILAIFHLLTSFGLIVHAQENVGTDTQTTEQTDVESQNAATGQEDTESENAVIGQDIDAIYEGIYEELDLKALERALEEEGIQTSVPFSRILKLQLQGDTKSVFHAVVASIGDTLIGDLGRNKNLMLELVGIVLVGSIFVNLASSFAGGFVSENGFYITYMIMTSILLTSFSMALAITTAALDKVLVAVRLLVPAFVLVLQFVGHATAAGGTYSIVLVGMWLIQVVIIRVVLPLIEFYVILSLVNNLQKDDSFSKLCELVQNIVKWLLRTIIVVVVGLNIIKGLLEPQMDLLGKTAVKRVLSAIPGGAMSVLAGTYLAAGMVIKNTIGIAGIIVLSCVCMLPLIKLFLLMFTVRITSALIQPMGDKRYVDGTSALSQGISLLMQALASSLVLFIITLALMAAATNTGGV